MYENIEIEINVDEDLELAVDIVLFCPQDIFFPRQPFVDIAISPCYIETSGIVD